MLIRKGNLRSLEQISQVFWGTCRVQFLHKGLSKWLLLSENQSICQYGKVLHFDLALVYWNNWNFPEDDKTRLRL